MREIMEHLNTHSDLNNFMMLIKQDTETLTIFLNKNNVNTELFFIVIEEINNLKGNYKITYCNEYKLFLILQLEDNINNWNSLEKLIYYSPKNNKTKHYETIRTQYQRWCSKGVFKRALDKVVPFNNVDNNIDNNIYNENYLIDINKDYFIDSTNINNLRGVDQIVINPELKKKKVTKITEISDVDGFVVAVSFNTPNIKIIKYNHQNKEIKTSKHDTKCIQETINNKNSNTEFNNICLIGDKGYKIKNDYSNNYEVITPNKKIKKKD